MRSINLNIPSLYTDLRPSSCLHTEPVWRVAGALLGMVAMLFMAPCAEAEQTATGETELTQLLQVLAAEDRPHSERWAAVQELRDFGSTATDPLVGLLAIDAGKARYYAIRALAYIADPRAVEPLSLILSDRSYGPRRYAALALGRIGAPQAIPALGQALSDISYVRDEALAALVRIGGTESQKTLEEFHFGGATTELELHLSCSQATFEVGDRIRIDLTIENATTESTSLAFPPGDPSEVLVLRTADGVFIEHVATGLRERGEARGNPTAELRPGESLKTTFSGRVTMWERGELDDQAFIASGPPFLTIDLGSVAYHVREEGQYRIQAAFIQGAELLDYLERSGIGEEQLERIWQGKAVSNEVSITVGRPGNQDR